MKQTKQELDSNVCTHDDQMRLFVIDGNRFPNWEKECLRNDTKIKSYINTSTNMLLGNY